MYYPFEAREAFQLHARGLSRDPFVVSVNVTEDADSPGWSVEVTLVSDKTQPRNRALHHLPSRYPPMDGESNVIVVETPNATVQNTYQEPPPQEVTLFDHLLLELPPIRPFKPKKQSKTVFDHLIEDSDDDPV
jgi:hypothetical protein